MNKLMKLLVSLIFPTMISGCLEIDVDLMIQPDKKIMADLAIKMSHELYELSKLGEDEEDNEDDHICDTGELTFTDEYAVCTMASEGKIIYLEGDEIIMLDIVFDDANGTFILDVDLMALGNNEINESFDVDSLDSTEAIAKALFAGKYFILRVSAEEITSVDGKGEIAYIDDGGAAVIKIPILELNSARLSLYRIEGHYKVASTGEPWWKIW